MTTVWRRAKVRICYTACAIVAFVPVQVVRRIW